MDSIIFLNMFLFLKGWAKIKRGLIDLQKVKHFSEQN